MLLMAEATVTKTTGCFLLQKQRDEYRFSSIYLSSFVHGKKGTETGNCKINRNQEMLTIDNAVLSKDKWKLSL